MTMPPKKVKSSSAGSHAPADHPPVWVMLKAAIVNLKDRKGSSRQAIMKYIQSNYKVTATAPKFKSAMKRCISKAVSEGKLQKTKGSFKLSSGEKLTKKHKSGAPGSKAGKPKKAGSSSNKPKKPKLKKAKKPKAAGAGPSATSNGPTVAKKVKKTVVKKVKKPKLAPKK